MKNHREDSRQVVDRFLGELGEPMTPESVEQGVSGVLDRIRAGSSPALRLPVDGRRSWPAYQWGTVAVAAVVLLAVGVLPIALAPRDKAAVATALRGDLYTVGVERVLSSSASIEKGKAIRAGAGSAAFTLRDGSQVEMSAGTELSIDEALDGLKVQLTSGTVIVTASKQRTGHLYVETRDCVVSVVGTVFTVNAEETGSRVSVIEGEVHVQRGPAVQVLFPGQQVSTAPTLGPVPLATEVSWSPNAALLETLFQQPLPSVRQEPVRTELRGAVQGVVQLRDKSAGIAEVAVSLCPGPSSTRVYSRTANGVEATRTYFYAAWDAGVAAGRCNATAASVTTDSTGRFAFRDVAPGQYTVLAQRDGYLGDPAVAATPGAYVVSPGGGQEPVVRYFSGWNSSQVGWNVSPRSGQAVAASQPVTVIAQQPTPEVTLTLTRGGVIAGRVRDAGGRPLANATVWVGSVAAGTPDVQMLLSATTNDRGEYRLFWLPPGEFYVGVDAGREPLTTYSWGRGRDRADVPQTGAQAIYQAYLSPAAFMKDAMRVTLREGEEASAADIVVPAVK